MSGSCIKPDISVLIHSMTSTEGMVAVKIKG